MGKILAIDDDQLLCQVFVQGLSSFGYDVESVTSAEAALRLLDERKHVFDVVLADVHMDGMDGISLCARIRELAPALPVILMTGFGDLESAVSAMRAGAYDFLSKPVDLDYLQVCLARAIEHARLSQEVKRLRTQVRDSHDFNEIIGSSAAMRRVYDILSAVMDSDSSVLLIGESGTGKEIIARTLHAHGPRRDRPFIAVNCAAIPEALLESELFGHKKGTFTDARTDRMGLFQRAHGGTIFLDEIAEMPPSMQVKLLRTLQERTVRPLGSYNEIPVDVRVIAATNRDIEVDMASGRFREDLYYRLNVVSIRLPALRDRDDDVLLLAQHYLDQQRAKTGKEIQGISCEAAEVLRAYDWPGNVRELQNCIERAVIVARHDQLVVEDLPERMRRRPARRPDSRPPDAEKLMPLDEVERRYVLRVLEATEGNRTLAANILGVDRKTLRRKLKQWGQSDYLLGDKSKA